MITEKEFDKEAALLAASVGGQLKRIDSVSDGFNNPANRINLQSFINPLTNKNYIPPTDLNQQMIEAAVQKIVPDDSTFSKMSSIEVTLHNQPSLSKTVNLTEEKYSKMEQELMAMRSLLERINSNLTKMSGMLGKVFCSFSEKQNLNK